MFLKRKKENNIVVKTNHLKDLKFKYLRSFLFNFCLKTYI